MPIKNIEITLVKKSSTSPHLTKIENVSKKINTSATIFYTPQYAIKKLNGSSPDYIQQREQHEKTLESWSAGALYHIHIKNGFELGAGLSYQKTVERFLWEQSSAGLVKREGRFFQQNTNRVKTHYNTLEHFDIPVFIGYQQLHNRWQYGIQASAIFNLFQKANGEILSPDLEPGHFISLNEHIFKKRTAPTFGADIKLGYRIMPGVNAIFSPGFKMQTKSITLSKYGAEQKYLFAYLQLGLNWGLIN